MAVDEPTEASPAKAPHHVGIGIAGSEEPQRCHVGQIATQRCVPSGAEQLEQGVETGQTLAAAFDQGAPVLGCSLQRVGWTKPVFTMEALGMKQREPSEDP